MNTININFFSRYIKRSALIIALGLTYIIINTYHLKSQDTNGNTDNFNGVIKELNNITERDFVYERPLVILDKGCSGSSAVLNQLRKIIEMHGFQFSNNSSELIKPRKNPLYAQKLKERGSIKLPEKSGINYVDNNLMIETLLQMRDQNQEEKKIFIFKINDSQFKDLSLDKLQPIVVGVHRDNFIDRCICSVKDCFKGSWGYPVFAANGTRTDLCFQRRKHPEIKIMAHLKTIHLPKCISINSELVEFIKSNSLVDASEELLFAYEYTDDLQEFQTSVAEWTKLLRPFLKHLLDENIIVEVLSMGRNSRSYSFHEDLIYNLDEVLPVLKDYGWDEQYLRLRSSHHSKLSI